MDRLCCLDHFDRFKRDVLAVQALEQSRAAAEQHGDEVDRDFVNEAEFEELLRNVCAPCMTISLSPANFFAVSNAASTPSTKRVHTTIGYVLGHTVRNDDRWYPSSAGWPVCSPIEY